MLDDEQPATAIQAKQIATGQYLALSNAVHALIASHSNPSGFSNLLDRYAAETERILLTLPALQADDGLRQAYSEVLRSLRSVIPKY